MILLQNYAEGYWVSAHADEEILYNAITGEPIYTAGSKALDFEKMLHYARTTGGKVLRTMSFYERGMMLKNLAQYLLLRKEEFYAISAYTGATRADSWVDIEGGIGNLFAYASLRKQLGNEAYYVDGQIAKLSKRNTFIGHHIMVPKQGVAIHINAFNFPVWGMLEKVAVNLLAGVPAIVKPASITSYLTEAVFKAIIESKLLPEGSLQLICGSARGILDHVQNQDVVTFTGSASTGKMLKSTQQLIDEAVPFNMEADSLNCTILGNDVTPDMPEFDIFVKEVVREMTTKAGQKCTAIRRIIVPENRLELVQNAIIKRLQSTTIGNPSVEGVRMGSLAGLAPRAEVMKAVEELGKHQKMLLGNQENLELIGADKNKGAFMSPILFANENPFENLACHNIEAFGPVSTIMPYRNLDDAIQLAKLGKGSLVSSITTASKEIAKEYVLGAANMHGRILVLNAESAKESTGHGSPMPQLVHGGPGRAGGGEEMGGMRGVMHYLQRTAIQGSPTMLTHITNQYQQGAVGNTGDIHPFKKKFGELQIGDQLLTDERIITSEDIDKFADLSGDHFYAHLITTDFTGTMFTQQVAHGYFIMSVAAGLFVDGYEKNPVLLNYGIDELRFTKPVYAGARIHIRFTCKEKLENETKPDAPNGTKDIPKGIVKWLVEMLDDSDEPMVGIATILTMVEK